MQLSTKWKIEIYIYIFTVKVVRNSFRKVSTVLCKQSEEVGHALSAT